jgi:hypothetical protein
MEMVPVAGIIRFSNVMVAHPSFRAKTVPEFIAYARPIRQGQHGVA